MSREPSDKELELRLCDVAVPEGMLERLQSIACGQEQLDRQLNEVALPDGMIERLKRIPQSIADSGSDAEPDSQTPTSPRRGLPVARAYQPASTDRPDSERPEPAAEQAEVGKIDSVVDSLIRDVPLPRAMSARLRQIPPVQRRHRAWVQSIGLAGVFLLGLHLLLGNIANTVRDRSPRPQLVVDNLPTVRWSAEGRVVRLLTPARLAPALSPQPSQDLESVVAAPVRPWSLDAEPPRIVARARSFINRHDLAEDVFFSRYGARGARPHYEDDLVPDLRFPSIIPPRGFDMPLVQQYDRAFLLRNGLRPPVFPAANPRLRTVTVPLSPTTKSFDDARTLVEEGRWPRPANVRAEDFLAALQYRFPRPPAGQLRLRVDGGPSLFTSSGSQLLQIVSQAGDAQRRRPQPVHLVVALDVSNSMRWSRKLESARQALLGLLDRLDDDDRVTLVVFNERVRMVFDRGNRTQRESLQRRVSALVAGGGTDVCAALGVALKHAVRYRDALPRAEVVLVTDDRSSLSSPRVAKVARLVTNARRQGVGLTVVDVDQSEEPSAALQAWSASAGRKVTAAPTPEGIRWSLTDILLGDSVVGRRVSVRVRFDPSVVRAYRLIGHDISHVLSPLEVQADAVLRSRESATCLFEVWLNPGKLGRLADIELDWTDGANQKRLVRRTVSRMDLAPTVEQLSLDLKAAAVAAETAEILRGGYRFHNVTRSAFKHEPLDTKLERVLRQAADIESELQDQPGFGRFVHFLKRLGRMRKQF